MDDKVISLKMDLYQLKSLLEWDLLHSFLAVKLKRYSTAFTPHSNFIVLKELQRLETRSGAAFCVVIIAHLPEPSRPQLQQNQPPWLAFMWEISKMVLNVLLEDEQNINSAPTFLLNTT